MDRNEFYEQMRKKIEENLPESILAEGELVIKEARKNNDVIMHGIMIFCIVFLLKSLTFARLCSPRYISCSFPRFHAACGLRKYTFSGDSWEKILSQVFPKFSPNFSEKYGNL